MRQAMRGTQRRRLGKGKRLLFAIIMFAPALVLLGAIEVTLRIFASPSIDDPFLHTNFPLAYRTSVVRDDTDFIGLSLPNISHIETDLIAARRNPDVFRIFCVGESASAGFPHPREETYSAYLRRGLEIAYPDRRFEIVDWSAHGFPHYLVRLVLMHMLDERPDLVVIFTGNNQAMLDPVYPVDPGLVERVRWFILRTRIAQWLQYAMTKSLSLAPFESDELRARGKESRKVLQRLPTPLRTDPAQYERMLGHYRHSLREMIGACRDRSIPAIVLTSPVNLRDWQPLVSVAGNRREQWSAWHDTLHQARAADGSGEHAKAADYLKAALTLEPDHAASHFALGKVYLKIGNAEAARQAFQRAVDLDARPYRATTDSNAIVREVAAEFQNASLVDLARVLAEHSPAGITGNELFLDHVHMNRAGNLLVAGEVFKAAAPFLANSGTIPAFPEIPASRLPNGEPYSEDEDVVLHSSMFWIFAFMHQYQAMEAGGLQVLELQQRHAGFTPDRRGNSLAAALVENGLRMSIALREAGVRDDPLFVYLDDDPELEKIRLNFYRLF